MGELLPACNTVIFDEAHQLPEVAGLFFGTSLSTTQLIELARDVRNEGLASAKDYAPLQEAAIALDKAARDLRLSRTEVAREQDDVIRTQAASPPSRGPVRSARSRSGRPSWTISRACPSRPRANCR